MGSSSMKFLVILALMGCALAEAEADAYYGWGGYGLGYRSYGGYGLGYSGYGGYGLGYAARPYGYSRIGYSGHYIGKREAEAEPEAKPEADADAWYGSYGLGYSGLYGGYGLGYSARPYGYSRLGYSGHYIGKREAEAEPEADADAYYGYG